MLTAIVVASSTWSPSSGRIVGQTECALDVTWRGQAVQAHLYQIEADSGTLESFRGNPDVLDVIPLDLVATNPDGSRIGNVARAL